MGHRRVMELLLVNGGDPLISNLAGFSAIDEAFKYKQEAIVNYLNDFLNTENYEKFPEQDKFTLQFCMYLFLFINKPNLNVNKFKWFMFLLPIFSWPLFK